MNVGSAVGREAGHILLGSDTRRTGQILAHAVISGVLASGGDVTSCGIVPTPAVAYCTRNFTAGCMVTASHNPEEHRLLLERGTVVIELLDLAGVPEGDYRMVALPLRLENLDGSPCRVLLFSPREWMLAWT